MSTELATAEAFLRSYGSGTKRQRERLLRKAPWEAVRIAALHHPDSTTRWWLLFLLDHHANDASTSTFAEALHDLSPTVRGMALHSIACEPCKDGSLCVADVVPSLIETLLHDPSARLRLTSLEDLLRLGGDDDRVRAAIDEAATHDPDPLVRKCCRDALAGAYVRPRKTYERSQRRHSVSRSRKA